MARRHAKKITETRWGGFSAGASALAAGTIGVNIAASSAISRETILRVRGTLVAYLDGTQAPGAQIRVSVGWRLAADGTGTTVTVDPNTDAGYPWFYFSEFILGYEEAVTDVIAMPGLSVYREVIDSKAMRVIRPFQEIQLVISNVTTGAASPVNVQMQGRILFGD